MVRLALIGIGTGAILGIAVLHCSQFFAPAGPIVVPDAKAFTLSFISGDEATVKLGLHNRGNAPLHIRHVSASCSCSDVTIDRELVTPGQRATLSVMVRKSSVTRNGHIATVTVESDDTRFPVLQIPVIVAMIDGLMVTPSVIDFGGVDRNNLPVFRVAYVSANRWSDEQQLGLKCESTESWLKIDKREYDSCRRESVVTLKLVGPVESGTLKAKVRFSLADDETGQQVDREVSVLAIISD